MTIARRRIKEENYGTRPQTVLYRISSEHVILLAAPMPGLEPQNISVSMRDNVVQIKGEERGPRQHVPVLSGAAPHVQGARGTHGAVPVRGGGMIVRLISTCLYLDLS